MYRPVKVRLAMAGIAGILLSASSCYTEKPVSYFQKGLDTTLADAYRAPEPIIQKGDYLSITFFSDNPAATTIFNQPSMGGGASSQVSAVSFSRSNAASTGDARPESSPYVVDSEGAIRLHAIGKVQADGLTKQALENLLTEKIVAMGVLSNPYCVVRQMGTRVTILGEVHVPGIYMLQNDRATIFEALGMAGDIMFSGRKEDVIRVREEKGRRTYAKLDLSNADILRSGDLYLRNNDLLVVQANKYGNMQGQIVTQQNIAMLISLVSVIGILFNTFR